MSRHTFSTKLVIVAFILSFSFHALIAVMIAAMQSERTPLPAVPVRIVNLPPEIARNLPPLQEPVPAPPARPVVPPVPAPRPIPEKRLSPEAVPKAKKFGSADDITVPKTTPQSGAEKGAESGKESGKTTMPAPEQSHKIGPLPFLSQNDIDELARKGMPQKKNGDDSVTLDTDEFKFISYNRWLKIKVESVLKYPELAAISGYQGALYIQFDIMKDGSLGRFEILKSSGYKILDDEAERSIRSSSPFQPLPAEWHMDRYSIRAAVIFYLGEGYIR